MSELISGKEALIALANGEDVQLRNLKDNWYKEWTDYNSFKFKTWIGFFIEGESSGHEFRIKPRTITIVNIEVPAPFKPKVGDEVWFLNDDSERGYGCSAEYDKDIKSYFGWWRTEGEIEKVVAALREVFK